MTEQWGIKNYSYQLVTRMQLTLDKTKCITIRDAGTDKIYCWHSFTQSKVHAYFQYSYIVSAKKAWKQTNRRMKAQFDHGQMFQEMSNMMD